MKKIYFITLIFIISFSLIGCSTTEQENDKTSNNELSVNMEQKEQGLLKDKSSEELDKIVKEKTKKQNTPKSNYPFFKEISTKTANIQDIKKEGGVEIGRGNIYLHGLSDNISKKLDSILNKDESLYSFRIKGTDINMFLTTRTFDTLKKEISNNFTIIEENSINGERKELLISVNGTNYRLVYIDNNDLSNLISLFDLPFSKVEISTAENQ